MRTPDHYDMKIQPVDYIMLNNLGFCEGNVVKYISRWREKGGIADLKKAKHYIDMLIDATNEDSISSYLDCAEDKAYSDECGWDPNSGPTC